MYVDQTVFVCVHQEVLKRLLNVFGAKTVHTVDVNNRNCGCVNGATLAICGTTGGGHGSVPPVPDMHLFMPAHRPRNDTYVCSGCYKTHGQDLEILECPGGGGALRCNTQRNLLLWSKRNGRYGNCLLYSNIGVK